MKQIIVILVLVCSLACDWNKPVGEEPGSWATYTVRMSDGTSQTVRSYSVPRAEYGTLIFKDENWRTFKTLASGTWKDFERASEKQ